MSESCSNCHFWRETEAHEAKWASDARHCRRHSPDLGSPIQLRMWPQSRPLDWCGDWQQKDREYAR
jgi:hypothetical protein